VGTLLPDSLIRSPVWSVDVGELAWLDGSGVLYRATLATSSVSTVAAQIQAIDGFAADGTLFFRGPDQNLGTSSMKGHPLYQQPPGGAAVATINSAAFGFTLFSADRARVAFFGDRDTSSGSTTLYTLSSGAAAPVSLGSGCVAVSSGSVTTSSFSQDGARVAVNRTAGGANQGLYVGVLAGPLQLVDAEGWNDVVRFCPMG